MLLDSKSNVHFLIIVNFNTLVFLIHPFGCDRHILYVYISNLCISILGRIFLFLNVVCMLDRNAFFAWAHWLNLVGSCVYQCICNLDTVFCSIFSIKYIGLILFFSF